MSFLWLQILQSSSVVEQPFAKQELGSADKLVGAWPFVGKSEVGLVQTSFAVAVEFELNLYRYLDCFVQLDPIPWASCMG